MWYKCGTNSRGNPVSIDALFIDFPCMYHFCTVFVPLFQANVVHYFCPKYRFACTQISASFHSEISPMQGTNPPFPSSEYSLSSILVIHSCARFVQCCGRFLQASSYKLLSPIERTISQNHSDTRSPIEISYMIWSSIRMDRASSISKTLHGQSIHSTSHSIPLSSSKRLRNMHPSSARFTSLSTTHVNSRSYKHLNNIQ